MEEKLNDADKKKRQRAHSKKHRKNNLEKCRKTSRDWNREHKEKCKEIRIRFNEKHPEHKHIAVKKRRKWRRSHTAQRNKTRATYYTKHRYNPNGRRLWTYMEEQLLFSFRNGDVKLAKYIQRSVGAVQIRRSSIVCRRRKQEGK